MIKGLLSKYESTEAGYTVTLKCDNEQGAGILSLHKKEVTVDETGAIQSDRATSLACIRSLAKQVAEAIDRELNGVDEDTEGLMTAMEFDKESGR